jgi:hypothetical protein
MSDFKFKKIIIIFHRDVLFIFLNDFLKNLNFISITGKISSRSIVNSKNY